jgi:hypothetical protein
MLSTESHGDGDGEWEEIDEEKKCPHLRWVVYDSPGR